MLAVIGLEPEGTSQLGMGNLVGGSHPAVCAGAVWSPPPSTILVLWTLTAKGKEGIKTRRCDVAISTLTIRLRLMAISSKRLFARLLLRPCC